MVRQIRDLSMNGPKSLNPLPYFSSVKEKPRICEAEF